MDNPNIVSNKILTNMEFANTLSICIILVCGLLYSCLMLMNPLGPILTSLKYMSIMGLEGGSFTILINTFSRFLNE